MADMTLKDAIDDRGPYAVWDLMTEDEQIDAATALWQSGDRDTRALVELSLAKELKFRAQSVRRLSAAKVAPRLARMASSLPETVLFQFLFHLHMGQRKPLLVEFLDAVGLPHSDGVLDLGDDPEAPDAAVVKKAGQALLKSHDRQGLVYLATLLVADAEFWSGVEPLLEKYDENGEGVK